MDIELETSNLMMIVFIFAFVISMWKIYPFLQTKTLADDDTTKDSQEELSKLVLKHMANQSKEDIDTKELLEKIKNDEDFDKKHFWRFNQNKLNQIIKKLD